MTSEESRKVFSTLNKQHQLVVLNMVERGMKQYAAYLDVYPDSSLEAARSSSSDLLTNPTIKLALEEIKKEQRDRAAVDFDWSLSKLVQLVDIGMFRPTPEQLESLTDDEKLAIQKVGTDLNAVRGVINEINRMQGNHAAEKRDLTSNGGNLIPDNIIVKYE